MKRRVLSALLVFVLSLAMLGGCGRSSAEDNTTPTTTTEAVPTTTTTAPTVSTTIPSSPEMPEQDPALYNRLTGEYDNAAGGTSRPVAVMVANDKYKARPQVGLSAADLFFETETEGGITRIMAVFSDISRVPAQVAPVRSARTPFVKIAQSLDAIYIHAGGSTGADALLSELESAGKINRLNALGNNGNAFWRDAALRASRDYEHSLSTGGTGLVDRVASRNWRTTSENAPFTFGTSVTGTVCNKLTVKMSSSETSSFVYNANTARYTKCFGDGTIHTDTDGNAIEVTNVLVMYDKRFAESDQHIGFTLQSGSGILFSGGTQRVVQWTRTESGLSFTENGAAATFLPGKTYVCLVSDGYRDGLTVE